MKRVPFFVLLTVGVTGCPQPAPRPDVTQPDVVLQDRAVTDTAPRPDVAADTGDPRADAGMDASATPDAAVDAAVDAAPPTDGATGPTEQIRAIQMAAAGTVNLPLDNVLVTFVVPAITGATAGNDPAGFSVQAGSTGPALFVAVDPATLMPAPAVGDRVSFRATMTRAVNNGASRWISALTGYARASGGNPVDGLTQDLSSAADVVSALGTYEYELSRLTGTITDNGANSGAAFRSFAITTAGIAAGDANLRLRMPEALASMLGARQGCRFTVGPTPLWRFRDSAQPSAWTARDIMLSMCPPATDAGVDAMSPTDASVSPDAMGPADASVAPDVMTPPDASAPDAAPPSDGGCVPRIVINEVQSRGAAAGDEFIELFNAGTCAVNLSGWTLQYLAASATAGATGSVKWTGTAGQTLAPGQLALLRSGVIAAPAATVLDLGTVAAGLGLADSGGVGLFNGTARIDSVAYQQMGGTMVSATHPHLEGMPATSPPSGGNVSISRVPNGADTNANQTDFQPRTTGSPGVANM
jgi:hypothetical protein